MKLRLRSLESKATFRIKVPDQCTFEHLKQQLLKTLSSSSSADLVHLSLNRNVELQGSSPEVSLQSMGITSGDLVYYTFNPSGFSSQGRTSIQSWRSSSQCSSSPRPHVEGRQLQVIDRDLRKPRLENEPVSTELEEEERILETNCEEMEVGDEPIEVVEKKCSKPIFLRRMLKEELGHDRNAHKLLVTFVHTVLLASGFVLIDPNLGSEINLFDIPLDWPSPSFSLLGKYTLPKLLAEGGKSSTMIEVVLLKFQSLRHIVNVYGALNCSSGSSSIVHRVSLDERKFAPILDLIREDSVSSQIMDENYEGKNPEQQVFEFWKTVKDDLAFPLLIDLCEPASFMLLPVDVKLKILEALPGVDIGRIECVCTELHYLASTNELWKMKFDQEFGLGEDAVSGNRLWKQKFVQLRKRKAEKQESQQCGGSSS